MSLLLMRFMLRKKKTSVTAAIQTRLSSSDGSSFPKSSPLVTLTVCVRGKNVFAMNCMNAGRLVSGKKVPLNRNIGVMKRNAG